MSGMIEEILSAAVPGDGNPGHILLVDDTPINRKYIAEVLKQKGFNVDTAINGAEAIRLIENEQLSPDLVLLDIMMPEMDGYETIVRLKNISRLKNVPVIFLSASIGDENVLKGFELGAADYISKPCKPPILLARVKTQLTLYRQTRQLERLAAIDSLTQVANRRRFDQFLDEEWRRCQRSNDPLSLVLIDIDYFKNYNDTYGHQEGDKTLTCVAREADKICRRPGDLAARYGGEEFSLILSNTDNTGAMHIAEKLRRNVVTLQIPHLSSRVDNTKIITVSIGVATMIPNRDTHICNLIRCADEQLYAAKSHGRNRVSAYDCTSGDHR